MRRLYEFAQRLRGHEFPEVMEEFRAKRDLEWRGELLEVWAERDLKGARAWFEAQPLADQGKLFARLASVWGRADVGALTSWVLAQPEKTRQALAPTFSIDGRELVAALAERDPEAAGPIPGSRRTLPGD